MNLNRRSYKQDLTTQNELGGYLGPEDLTVPSPPPSALLKGIRFSVKAPERTGKPG